MKIFLFGFPNDSFLIDRYLSIKTHISHALLYTISSKISIKSCIFWLFLVILSNFVVLFFIFIIFFCLSFHRVFTIKENIFLFFLFYLIVFHFNEQIKRKRTSSIDKEQKNQKNRREKTRLPDFFYSVFDKL